MSPGKVWLIPMRSTVTFVTVPVSPATAIFDGYGAPAARSLIAIAAAFAKSFEQVPIGDAVAVAVAVFVFVGVPVAVFVAVAVEVFAGVAHPLPEISDTSSTTKLPVPLVGPIYSNVMLCDAPLA
jgi:hypothetical protein